MPLASQDGSLPVKLPDQAAVTTPRQQQRHTAAARPDALQFQTLANFAIFRWETEPV